MTMIETCVAAVEAAGGRLVFDPTNPDHQVMMDPVNGITLKLRGQLAREQGILLAYENKILTRMYKQSTSAPVAPSAPKPLVVPNNPIAVAPKTGASHSFVKPPFFDELVALMDAGKNWTTEKPVNLLFVGPKGCIIGSTKIRVRKVGNGLTPILTVKD